MGVVPSYRIVQAIYGGPCCHLSSSLHIYAHTTYMCIYFTWYCQRWQQTIAATVSVSATCMYTKTHFYGFNQPCTREHTHTHKHLTKYSHKYRKHRARARVDRLFRFRCSPNCLNQQRNCAILSVCACTLYIRPQPPPSRTRAANSQKATQRERGGTAPGFACHEELWHTQTHTHTYMTRRYIRCWILCQVPVIM